MNEIKRWMNSNFLKLNATKTQLKLFRPNKISLPFLLNFDGETLDHVNEINLLGVRIANDLDFKPFINKKVKTCNFKLRNLWHIRDTLTHKTRVTLVTSTIISNLDYCNSLLICSSGKDIKPLQLTLNRAVRFICGINSFTHITPYLKKLHFLPIFYRIEFKSCLLCFKIFHELAPQYLQDEFVKFRHSTTTALRTETRYVRDEFMFENQLSSHKRETIYQTMKKRWNKLPLKIRKIKKEHMDQFKAQLKTYLFIQAFP